MALFKRGPVWWIRVTYQGKQLRRSLGTTDKELAKHISRRLLGQIAEGKWFDRLSGAEDEKTVRELLERYLREYSALNKAPKTHRRDKSLADHFIRLCGDLPLSKLRPAMLAEYKAKRRAEGYAPKTVNDELKLLTHAYKLAINEWEWATENPAAKVSRDKVRNQIERWLTADEEQRLLSHSPPWLRDMLRFALHTGLRQGEILNLQWFQVDLFRRTMTILEQKNRCKDTLPLNATAMELLTAIARRQIQETGSEGPSGFVFANQAGNRMDARDLLRTFYTARRKAKLEGFRFHDLRHTWATRLVQNGVDLYTVQKLGRWKTVSMVMRYAHHYPESLRPGAEILDRLGVGTSTTLAHLALVPSHPSAQPVEKPGAPGPT